MVALHFGCLFFRTPDGDTHLCVAKKVALSLLVDHDLDDEIITEVTDAVVYYLKVKEGRDMVTVPEFSQTLKDELTHKGFIVNVVEDKDPEDSFEVLIQPKPKRTRTRRWKIPV